jgi:RimJ/RimL family protein N-acetyltransferase
MLIGVTARTTTTGNAQAGLVRAHLAECDAGGYPDDLVSDVVMDFGLAHVRPIRREDATTLVAFHEGLSRQSQYLRFFTVHPHLSPAELQRFTRVDYHERLALVVEVDGELVAVGRYDRIDGTSDAEVAFVVADPYQCHGLGAVLLHRLVEVAAARGITGFVAEVMPENQRMRAVFGESGFDIRTAFDQNVVTVTFPIAPQHGYVSSRGLGQPPASTPAS